MPGSIGKRGRGQAHRYAGYVVQPLHPLTNATCGSLTCYARSEVIVLKDGRPLGEHFCRDCAVQKVEACVVADGIGQQAA
jgi:hypothetical protein